MPKAEGPPRELFPVTGYRTRPMSQDPKYKEGASWSCSWWHGTPMTKMPMWVQLMVSQSYLAREAFCERTLLSTHFEKACSDFLRSLWS